jgi:transposase
MKTPLCTEEHHHPAPHLSGNVHSLSPEEIAAHSLSAPTTVERRRWQVIALLAEQTPIAEIVAATGYRPRTIRQIAQRYRESGSAGLADGRQRGAGAVPLLSDAQQRELRQALQSLPPDGGAWTGPKVAEWIAARTGRGVHRQRGWEYLRRLGTGVTAAPTAHDDQPVDR